MTGDNARESLDRQLAQLRRALPQRAFMLTVFPGSLSLGHQSSAVAMLDLVGQPDSDYFTPPTLPGDALGLANP